MMQPQTLHADVEAAAAVIIAGNRTRPPLSPLQKSAWELPLEIFAKSKDYIICLSRCGENVQTIVRNLASIYEIQHTPTVGRLEVLVQRLVAQWLRDADPELAPYSLVNYQDIREVNGTCMTVTHYLDEYFVSIQHDHPESIEAGLEYYRRKNPREVNYQEFIIRTYGKRWFRVWHGGRLRPVRTRNEIARIRQEMANGTFYIPEDFNVPQSQIDLAYDL